MIKYFLENPEWELKRATEGASGYDLRCARTEPRVVAPGERWNAPTGLYLEMPIGVEGQIRSRSGLSLNHGVIVLNAPGTIDSDYRGEVSVTLINLGQRAWTMVPGERIAQLVFAPVFAPRLGQLLAIGLGDTRMSDHPTAPMLHELIRVSSRDELSDTARGSGGHGSTGR